MSFKTLLRLTLPFLAAGICGAQTAQPYDVHAFGAAGDGATLDTKALQAAIDKCSAGGGGTVLVAGGRFVTGTLYLKSNVTLRVEGGAAILGDPNVADYTTDTDRATYNEPFQDVGESETNASVTPTTLL